MIRIIRTDAQHPDFTFLVRQLDSYLAVKDGEDHSFYDQFNQTEDIKYVILAFEHQSPVGCGAMKQTGPDTIEIKRMYVNPDKRSKGIATQILKALEDWASELAVRRCILETGKRQPDAIKLYQKNGYQITPNYGPYIHVENSVCFEKNLI